MIASPAIEPISPENDTEGYFELVIRSVHISLNLRSAIMPLQQSKIEQELIIQWVIMVTNLVTLNNRSKILQYAIARYL